MKARRYQVEMTYNGVEATAEIGGDLTSFTYTDAVEESDSITLNLRDPYGKWVRAWSPRKGDLLRPRLRLLNWETEISELSCGEHLVDTFRLSGPPGKLELKGVSIPADTPFQNTKRSKTWEAVTIRQIETEIANRYGMEAIYDGDEILIQKMEQNQTPDSSFLKTLCQKYGMGLKIFNRRLIAFSYEAYERKAPCGILTPFVPGLEWTYQGTIQGTYTGAKVSYTDPKKKTTVEITVGKEGRLYNASEKAESLADAERIGRNAVLMANRKETTMSVKLAPDFRYVSGNMIRLTEFGIPDGDYLIEKVIHSVSGTDYRMQLALSRKLEVEI